MGEEAVVGEGEVNRGELRGRQFNLCEDWDMDSTVHGQQLRRDLGGASGCEPADVEGEEVQAFGANRDSTWATMLATSDGAQGIGCAGGGGAMPGSR